MIKSNKNRLAFLASLDLQDFKIHEVTAIWTKYETELHCSIKNNGSHHTLSRYKEGYMFLRNLVLHLPTQPISFCKVDKRGIPKILWSLRPLLSKSRDLSRVALSIARSFELITLEIDYSTDSIEKEGSYDPSFQETKMEFKRFLQEFSQKYP